MVFFAAINGKFTKQLQFFCCRVSETSQLDIYWFRMTGLKMVLLRTWNAKMVASSIRERHIVWDAKCSHIEIPHDPEHDFSCHVIWDTCAVKRPMRITYKQHADRLRGCAVNGLRWALADRANANNVDAVLPNVFSLWYRRESAESHQTTGFNGKPIAKHSQSLVSQERQKRKIWANGQRWTFRKPRVAYKLLEPPRPNRLVHTARQMLERCFPKQDWHVVFAARRGNKTTQSLQGSNAARDEGHAHGRGTSPAHNSEKQTIAAFVVANRCFSGCDPYLGCWT